MKHHDKSQTQPKQATEQSRQNSHGQMGQPENDRGDEYGADLAGGGTELARQSVLRPARNEERQSSSRKPATTKLTTVSVSQK